MKKFIFLVWLVLITAAPARAWGKMPDVLNHLGNDTLELSTSWPMVVFVGGGTLAIALTPADHDVETTLNPGNNRRTWNKTLGIIGAPYVIDSAAGVTFLAGAIAQQPAVTTTGETLSEALVLTESTTLALKLAVRRKRPDGGNYSFPSGHAARTFAVATVLETLHGPLVGIPSYVLAGLISFSRLDAHEHHLSDVVFGSALGTAIGWASARFHKKTGALLVSPLVGNATGIMLSGRF